MRLLVLISACALLMGSFSGSLYAAPESVVGDWVGGFKLNQQWVFIKACFKLEHDALTATVDFPLEGLLNQTFSQIGAEAFRLHFELPWDSGTIIFDGQYEDGTITGICQQAGRQGSFQFVRPAAVAEEVTDRYIGSYQFNSHRTVLIEKTEAGLAYHEFGIGRVGRLSPLSETTFFSGPLALVDLPVEVKVKFVKSGDGGVMGLIWQEPGFPERYAARN